MFSLRQGWLLASAPALLLTIVARADEVQTSAAIAKLLDVGWAATPQARAAADVQYQEVIKVAGSDSRALAASWLVLLQQRRYEEARKRLDEHLVKNPADLQALRAKTWVLALFKNYSAAMLAADKLSAQLAMQPAGGEADRAVEVELVSFLGRLLGYLGGPVADAVGQDERKALEKKLVDRLDESRRAVFEEASNGVLAKFIEMSDDSFVAQERAAALAQAEKDKTLTELAADREAAASRAKDLDERRKKVQDEFRDELDRLAKQDQPLVRELARLSSQASSLTSDLLFYSSEVGRLQQLAAGENDAGRKQQLLFEADRLALIAGRIDADLLGVSRLAQGVRSQRAALAARQAQAQGNSASQVQRIENELNDLAKRERRNEGIEKRASRPASGATSRSRSLSAQATALTTYDSFPLEAAKAQLLETLR